MYKLMIKTNSETDMKYLCITKRDSWKEYSGSGSRWLTHNRKHGGQITTELLFESEDYKEFQEMCVFVSDSLDVANSPDFANVIPEHGYDNSNSNADNSNLVIWWRDFATEEDKQKIYDARSKAMTGHHAMRTCGDLSYEEMGKLAQHQHKILNCPVYRESIISKISSTMKLVYANLPDHAHEKRYEGIRKFFNSESSRRDDERERRAKQFSDMRKRYTDEEWSEEIRRRRLSLTEEQKLKRVEKIRQVYATGKFDEIYERFSLERRGVGNPMATIVEWSGVQMCMGDFKKLIKELGISNEEAIVNHRFKRITPIRTHNQEEIQCPHCGKKSTPGKATSAFMRWHFDNCKNKSITTTQESN